MAVKETSAEQAVAPNLVPMVDIMFLLLLFLMLGADMGQRELEEVKLPVASSSQPEDPKNVEVSRRLTINVFHAEERCAAYEGTQLCPTREHWVIGIRGTDYRDPVQLKARLVAEARDDKERRVMIRADQAALFEQVQLAFTSCAEAGLYKVELGAAVVADEPDGH